MSVVENSAHKRRAALIAKTEMSIDDGSACERRCVNEYSQKFGGEWGIRTPEGVNPTRFPSVRHRPLGEFSTAAKSGLGYLTRDRAVVPTTPCARPVRRHGFGLYNGCWLLAWRHPGQIPQDGNVARVTGLWRVREGSLLSEAQNRLEALLLRRLLWQVRALPAAADRPRTAVLVA